MQIKCCGFVDPGPAMATGADLAGLVFWPRSKRAVDTHAAVLAEEARAAGLQVAGVFVDRDEAGLRSLAARCRLDVLQLHGAEPLTLVRVLAREHRVWKAFRVGPDFDPDDARRAWDAGAEAVLLDAWHPTEPGGTGHTADWERAAGLALEGPVVLAGGLTPSNVTDAIARVRPWGVDASSGLEVAPGRKEPALVRAFIEATRGAARVLGTP